MRDELEATLAEYFDVANLSVYGDYLQSIGDPRGELIALDLADDIVDVDARRTPLICAWLGDELAALISTSTIEYGFITDLWLDGNDAADCDRRLDMLLASPAGAYLRGITIHDHGIWIASALARIVARPLPWLTRLSLQVDDPATSPIIDGPLAARLIEATPQLEQLEVWGSRVIGELPHPAVRSLRITGYDAVGSLLGHGPPLRSLAVLDLAFAASGAAATLATSMLPRRCAPALRRLDLSRNEPGRIPPHALGGTVDSFEFLEQLELRDRLTHVRLPSVRVQRQADRLESTIATMPYLRELVIARSYNRVTHLPLPSVVRVPQPWPWPPMEDLEPMMIVTVGSLESPAEHVPRFELSMPHLVGWLEDHFDDLPYAAREWWRDRFGTGFGSLSKPSLLAALEPIDVEYDGLAMIASLRATLQASVADGVRVTIQPADR